MRVHFLSTTLASRVRQRVGVRENLRNGSSLRVDEAVGFVIGRVPLDAKQQGPIW